MSNRHPQLGRFKPLWVGQWALLLWVPNVGRKFLHTATIIYLTTNFTLFFFFTAAKMTDRKAVIKNADMAEDMQQDAVDCATTALEKYNIEKDIAAYIKKEFDKKYNPTWHCIIGRNFGSYVTHETKHFIYFYLGQVAILLFKSGWEGSIRSFIKIIHNFITCHSISSSCHPVFYYLLTLLCLRPLALHQQIWSSQRIPKS